MSKTSKDLLFNIFAIFLFLFIAAFINYWNKNMTDVNIDTADKRWLIYSIYLLSVYSIFLWGSHFSSPIRGIHLVCLLWCIVMPVVILYNHGRIVDALQTILWPLLFEVSFLFVKLDKDNLNAFRKLFIVVTIYGAYFFLESRYNIFLREHSQSNTIYFVFLTLHWLLLVKGMASRLSLLILFTFLGVWSLKRSIMLSLVFIWSSYIISLLRGTGKKWIKILIVVALIGGGIYGYSYGDEILGGELSERVNREETDEGRNRLAIYTVTWAMIQSSDPSSLILGHGHFSVRRDSILEISAHNDFLEVIYDYGLVIFILYIGLVVYVIKRSVRLFRSNSELFLPYAVSLSIFIVMSMVSHLILYTSYFNYLVLFWGSVEGFYSRKTKLKKALR